MGLKTVCCFVPQHFSKQFLAPYWGVMRSKDLALSRLIRKMTSNEKKTQKFALSFFLFGCVLVVVLQFTIGLYFTPQYFLAHFCLGLFLPYFFYSIGASPISFWVGFLVTSVFHFGYELWEDQLSRTSYSLDWDQILAGGLGLFVAYLVYRAWNNRFLNANLA